SGIFTKQSALWPAQNLYPLNINKIKCCGSRTGKIYPVNIKSYTRVNSVIGKPESRTKPPYIQGSITRIRRIELYGRYKFLKPVHIKSPGIFSCRTPDHRNGNRYVLNRFLPAAGRNYDILKTASHRFQLNLNRPLIINQHFLITIPYKR